MSLRSVNIGEASTVKVPVDLDLSALRSKIQLAIDAAHPVVSRDNHWACNDIVQHTATTITWSVDGQFWQCPYTVDVQGNIALSTRTKVKPTYVAAESAWGYTEDDGKPTILPVTVSESFEGSISKSSTSEKGWSWNVDIISSGLTKTANCNLAPYGFPGLFAYKNYSGSVLSEAAPLFDNAPFVLRSETEHLSAQNGGQKMEAQQSLVQKVGGIFNKITVAENADGSVTVKGKLALRHNDAGRAFRDFLTAEVEKGNTVPYQLSWTGIAEAEPNLSDPKSPTLDIKKIKQVDSVDPCLVGNAGGRIISTAESAVFNQPVQSKMKDKVLFYKLLAMAVAEAGVEGGSPDEALAADFKTFLIKNVILKFMPEVADLADEAELAEYADEKLIKLAGKALGKAGTATPEAEKPKEEAPVAESAKGKTGDLPPWAKDLMVNNTQSYLENKLSTSNLHKDAQDVVRDRFKGQIAEAGIIDEEIRRMKKAFSSVTVSESLQFVAGQTEGDKLEKAVTAFMFAGCSESVRKGAKELYGYDVLANEHKAFYSFRDLYTSATGGNGINAAGGFGKGSRGAVSEAAHADILTQLVAATLHRRQILEYQNEGEWNWYEKVTKSIPVTDFKAYTVQNYGNFSNPAAAITENEEYPEISLTGNETKDLTLVERGGQFGIGWRTVVNDDVAFVQGLAGMLAKGSRKQLAKYIGDLFQLGFTSVLAPDGNAVFTTGHANLQTAAALSGTTVNAMAKKLRLQTELGSSDAMALRPKFLVVPANYEDLAYPIITPGAGQYNTVATADQALRLEGVVVPHWGASALHKGYFVMAGPDQAEAINVLYLNGVQEPQIFQEVTESGFSFTHKRMRMRLEHHYQAGWVDYRPVVGCQAS